MDFLRKLFPRNINKREQLARLMVGGVFIALSFTGEVNASQEFWLVVLGWLGIASGIVGHCPVYALFGKSSAE